MGLGIPTYSAGSIKEIQKKYIDGVVSSNSIAIDMDSYRDVECSIQATQTDNFSVSLTNPPDVSVMKWYRIHMSFRINGTVIVTISMTNPVSPDIRWDSGNDQLTLEGTTNTPFEIDIQYSSDSTGVLHRVIATEAQV